MSVDSVLLVVHVECSQSEVSHALHNVLFNSTSWCHNTVHHFMLHQVTDGLSDSWGYHVGSVSQEDASPNLFSVLGIASLFIVPLVEWLVGKSPVYHPVDNFYPCSKICCLKSCCWISTENGRVVNSFVEVIPFDRLRFQLLVRHIY